MTVPNASQMRGAGAVRNVTLAFDGRVRVAFVLFGGMLALQSSPTLDATKIVYLVGVVICLVGALAVVWRVKSTRDDGLIAWIATSTALVVLIALSFLIARLNGTPIADWLRDVAAYALFAAVPIFALDAQISVSRKVLVAMLVVAGLLGGSSWAVEWLGRRQILELPMARLVFPSPQLPGMLYFFAMASAMTANRRRVEWSLVAGLILGLFLITGTRSSLLLLVGPLAMAVLEGRDHVGSSARAFLAHGLVAVAVVAVVQIGLALPALGIGRTDEEPGSSSPATTSAPDVLGGHLGSLPGLLGNPSSDSSIKERVAQYEAAWALFVSSPIVGVGPGHAIDWTDVSGYRRSGFTADTPLVLPAKFGLLGVFVFAGAAAAYVSTVRNALRRNGGSPITLALVGFGIWTIVGIPLGFAVEDKGASLALILVLGLAFIDRSSPQAIEATSSA